MVTMITEEIKAEVAEILTQGVPLTLEQAGTLMGFVEFCVEGTNFKPLVNGLKVIEEVRLASNPDCGSNTTISHWDDREEALTLTGMYRPRSSYTSKVIVKVVTTHPHTEVFVHLDPVARVSHLVWDIGANRNFALLSRFTAKDV